mmetsp:Transcript_4447/g.7585  ORF Transcript_4447/g.7585 Transcript_4447/m.7585 type:complete len:252 (-) Transcript_4447:794-1549(-)
MLLTPYKRIEAFYFFSLMELQSAKLTHQPYIDELGDAYEAYVEFVKEIHIHLDSCQALLSILKTLKNAKYADELLVHQLACHFFDKANFNLEDMVSRVDNYSYIHDQVIFGNLRQVQNVFKVLAFFNYEQAFRKLAYEFDAHYESVIIKLIDHGVDNSQLMWTILDYLRVKAIFGHEGCQGNPKAYYDRQMKIVRHLLSNYMANHIQVEQISQIYQYILVLKCFYNSQSAPNSKEGQHSQGIEGSREGESS